MLVAEKGHLDTVKALLAKGADVNIEDKGGWTALKLAKKFGHKVIVRLIEEVGTKE